MNNQKGKKNLGTYLKQAVSTGSSPSKEDLFTILFFLRQLMGILCGFVAGSMGLTGILVVLGYLVLNCLITYAYSSFYLKVDSEKVETTELFTEGLMISFMIFLISWIFTYTFVFLKSSVPIPSGVQPKVYF